MLFDANKIKLITNSVNGSFICFNFLLLKNKMSYIYIYIYTHSIFIYLSSNYLGVFVNFQSVVLNMNLNLIFNMTHLIRFKPIKCQTCHCVC